MKFDLKTAVKIGISVFLLYIAIHYWEDLRGLIERFLSAGIPLIAGAVLAYFVNILMSFYERHWFKSKKSRVLATMRRPVCMLGAFATLIAIVILVVGMVLPQLVSCIKLIISKVPTVMDFVVENAQKYRMLPEDVIDMITQIDWNTRVNELLKAFGSGVTNAMNVIVNVITGVFSGVVKAVVAIIFAIYLLSSKDKLKVQTKKMMNRYLTKGANVKTTYVIRVIDDCFHGYIVGQCIEALVLGVLCTIGMWILRIPYATMVGALMAVTALIPVAGAYIGAAVGAFMILTIAPVKALIFLVFIVILQQIEGNLIYPKVVGSSLGLPALWVLAAVTIGGGMLGIIGMLLGVPIAAAIYRIVGDDMERKIPGKNYKAEQLKMKIEN